MCTVRRAHLLADDALQMHQLPCPIAMMCDGNLMPAGFLFCFVCVSHIEWVVKACIVKVRKDSTHWTCSLHFLLQIVGAQQQRLDYADLTSS